MSKGKKIPSRNGLKFTALLGTTLEKDEIKKAVAASISCSSLSATGEWINGRRYKITATGLQELFYLRPTPDLFFEIILYSTGSTTEEEVRELLLSIPDVYQVRELVKEESDWSEAYDDELYYIDLPEPDQPSIPAECEFGVTSREMDEYPDPDLPTIPFYFPEPLEEDFEGSLSHEQLRSNQILLKRWKNAKAVWKHHQSEGYKNAVGHKKPINKKSEK